MCNLIKKSFIVSLYITTQGKKRKMSIYNNKCYHYQKIQKQKYIIYVFKDHEWTFKKHFQCENQANSLQDTYYMISFKWKLKSEKHISKNISFWTIRRSEFACYVRVRETILKCLQSYENDGYVYHWDIW